MFEDRKIDNFTMKITLQAIQDIVGENGLKSILNYAHLEKYIDTFPPENYEMEIPLDDDYRLYFSLLELFGSRGMWGLRYRCGREIFRLNIERRSSLVKAFKHSLRLLPENRRLRLILERFVEQYEKRLTSTLDTLRFELREEDDCFLVIDRDYHLSQGITSKTPVCSEIVGALEYLVEWGTGNKHRVEEIECRATGHSADVFKVAKAIETT